MKKLVIALVVCFGFIIGQHVWAGDEHAAEGVIKDIKASDNKLTISHGPIKTLGMDGMTMDFVVSDPGMLEVVEKGHAVSFVIEVDKKGNFIITDIEDKGMAN
ncbi:copper-binding protein [Kaarinaea lacus]